MTLACRQYARDKRGRDGSQPGCEHPEFSGSRGNLASRGLCGHDRQASEHFGHAADGPNWSATKPNWSGASHWQPARNGDDGVVSATARTQFDADYYDRFYRRAPVHDRRRIGHLASGVVGLARWWGLPLRNALDIGAGPGLWRDWFAVNEPKIRYRSTDVSEYACERFGHEQVDIATWTPNRQYDLVVCQGVLHYLDDRSASAAITNLAAACRGVLYLEAPTLSDRSDVIDTTTTDLAVHWRTGAWYRKRLDPYFQAVGAGLYVARSSGALFYELERSR
jgi:2-polyprenyl-3-methyl-5-hydroxy-6-metoxy-1,4-benzoquinol methylase